MGRTNRHEKGEHRERRIIIIEASGLIRVVSTANHRVKKTTKQHKHKRLVFA